MATNLYEVLEVDRNATAEEIRKAYKKRALQTHPDRITVPSEKEAATVEFRKLANAYEVLSDPEKRRTYDQVGVWPPPQDRQDGRSQHYRSHRRAPSFTDQARGPYREQSRYRERPFDDFVFMDPFQLFEMSFRDLFDDPIFRGITPFGRRPRPFDSWMGIDDPFMGSGFMRGLPALGMGPGFADFIEGPSASGNHRSRSMMNARLGSSGGRWVSESRMSQTVNGVTQSVWKRKDSDGNEYTTYTGRDGREQMFVNGVEQSTGRAPEKARDPAKQPPPLAPIQTFSQPQPFPQQQPYSQSPVDGGKRYSPQSPYPPPPPPNQTQYSGPPPPPQNQYSAPPLPPPPPYAPPPYVPPPSRYSGKLRRLMAYFGRLLKGGITAGRERRHSQEASQARSQGRSQGRPYW
ncbi:DnaJ-domain-containing protein [Artomyces pyxidatus]|uniref:DnaJ-domain-containing protein n=1 Tax=Artomyces pyxidatus TaxID=48021 RepID=A0ACB8SLX4_9AGAM|nr:DnaJ-domain-containing protein [Artomyces pyxidatus]